MGTLHIHEITDHCAVYGPFLELNHLECIGDILVFLKCLHIREEKDNNKLTSSVPCTVN